MPAGQADVHVTDDGAENFHVSHGAQREDSEAPQIGEEVPAGHGVQVAEANASAYLPASHGVHMALVGCPYVPVSQDMHVADDVDPDDVENLPATHMVHAEAPVEAMYLPASHAEHVDSEVAPDCAENLP